MASGVVSFMGVTETLNAYPTYIIAYLSLLHCLSPVSIFLICGFACHCSRPIFFWVTQLSSFLCQGFSFLVTPQAISHSGAINTLLDINHRFEIGAGDLAPIRIADLCSFGTYAFEPLTPLKTRNYAF